MEFEFRIRITSLISILIALNRSIATPTHSKAVPLKPTSDRRCCCNKEFKLIPSLRNSIQLEYSQMAPLLTTSPASSAAVAAALVALVDLRISLTRRLDRIREIPKRMAVE